MANLKLVPQNPFSWSFDVTQNNASIAQVLHTFGLKEKATLNIQGTTCQAYREHLMGGDYILEEQGQSLARAKKQSAFSSAFQVESSGTQLHAQERIPFRANLCPDGGRSSGRPHQTRGCLHSQGRCFSTRQDAPAGPGLRSVAGPRSVETGERLRPRCRLMQRRRLFVNDLLLSTTPL